MLSSYPKEKIENLQFRRKLYDRCERDAAFREGIMEKCKHDVLWWINAFAWVIEPRKLQGQPPGKLPFCTWPHQDLAIAELDANLGVMDARIYKSRGEGASWVVLTLFLHRWLFHPVSNFGLVSRTEKAAANMKDPDSLLYKVDWQLRQLPEWMAGPETYDAFPSGNSLVNKRNENTIAAYASTQDVAVGGRKLAFMFDEISRFKKGTDHIAWVSTQAVTECRIAVGTAFDAQGLYFDLVHDEDSDMVRIDLRWQDNPTRNRGLYRVVNGQVVPDDPVNNPLPRKFVEQLPEIHARLKRKGYVLEKGPRSPWYDRQCLRPQATPQNIARELDREFGGSDESYFSIDLINRLTMEVLRPPYKRGEFTVDAETGVGIFHETEEGSLLLWCNLLMDGTPPEGKYALGADISQGTAGPWSSLSCAVVYDVTTGEQVAEFTVRTMKPEVFAVWCVALCRWFHGAYLNFDATGSTGVTFLNELLRHYNYIYTRRGKKRSGNTPETLYGYSINMNKAELFGGGRTGVAGFWGAVESGKCKPRSADLIRECGEYVWVIVRGRLTAVHRSEYNNKGQPMGKDHGDRAIAAALGWVAVKDRPVGKVTDDLPPEAPENTLAGRVRAHERRLAMTGSADDFEW